MRIAAAEAAEAISLRPGDFAAPRPAREPETAVPARGDGLQRYWQQQEPDAIGPKGFREDMLLEAKLLDGLTETEIEALARLLAKLAASLPDRE